MSSKHPLTGTYEQAIFWLIQEWVSRPEFLADWVPLPPEGRLCALLFWVSEAQLKEDVRKAWAALFNEKPGRKPPPLKAVT